MTRRGWDRLQDKWAAGEPLSAADESLRRTHADTDPAARRELDALSAMAGLLERAQPDADDDELVERVLEQAGVGANRKVRYLPGAAPRSAELVGAAVPRRMALRFPAVAALAGSFAFVVAVFAVRTFRRGEPAVTAARPAAPPTEAEATLASASGEVLIEPSSAGRAAPSVAVAPGRRLQAGDRVRTGRGSACLRVQPAIQVCLGRDSDVELGSLHAPQVQILVARGVAVAALAPRAAGQSFALVGGDVVAVAHGTVYALDRTSALSVDVAVLEGTVAVRAPGRAGAPDLVPAHTRWRSQSATPAPLRVDEEATFSALLAPAAPSTAGMPERPLSPRAPSVEETPGPPRHGVVDSPDQFLTRARAALDRGDRRGALDWYQRLRERFPNVEAARTVLVTSGRLEMELRAPARALEDFQAYLRISGGALEMEALGGTARALRALGRVDDERLAIDRYLTRFPDGFDAPLLRSRRAELGPSPSFHASDPPR